MKKINKIPWYVLILESLILIVCKGILPNEIIQVLENNALNIECSDAYLYHLLLAMHYDRMFFLDAGNTQLKEKIKNYGEKSFFQKPSAFGAILLYPHYIEAKQYNEAYHTLLKWMSCVTNVKNFFQKDSLNYNHYIEKHLTGNNNIEAMKKILDLMREFFDKMINY